MGFLAGGVKACAVACALTVAGTQLVFAQINDMACISLSELRSTDTPSRLARSVRDCARGQRFEEAIQVFFAYSMYYEFDRKRVVFERQNDAIVDLNNWLFADFPRPILNELRYFSQVLRDREGALFAATCGAMVAAGPPSYLPYYLVGRGIEKEVAKPGWQVEAFDAQAAWEQGLAVNGCPVG